MSSKEKMRGGQGQVLDPETFRDSVSTIEQSGKRKWVYPKKPKGKFTNYRTYVSYFLLVVFFVLPFVKINGNPFLLINILDREFFIVGQPFYPQDFFILALGAITSIVFVILFSVAFGRIFCGWICPQTIFLEMLFRKIEYAIEGDRNKQIKLDKQKWDAEKIKKRLLKWSIYLILSLLITHTMFTYIVGYEEVLRIMKGGPIEHFTNFLVMLIFTGLFYFVFAWFREQACTIVCPYGRLQGVLIDKKTINVFYDHKRGEGKNGRAKFRKKENRAELGKGDCIDCNQCVVVCPTGIDIRNGQQLECVNCTACIDACDEVMDKMKMPRGLIRYASEDEIEKGEKFKFTSRMKAYTGVLVLLLGILVALLYQRGDFEAKFIRPAGSSYYAKEGRVANTFNYTLINKKNAPRLVTIKVVSPKNGKVKFSGSKEIKIQADEISKGTIDISFPENEIKRSKQSIEVGVYNKEGKLLDTYEVYFQGPVQSVL